MLPQTRVTWVQRKLLGTKEAYGQLDVLEQVVLKELLRAIPKGDVAIAWAQVRPLLRDLIPVEPLSVIWDPSRRRAHVSADAKEIVGLVRHGRPTYVVAVGEAIEAARAAYLAEAAAFRDAGVSTGAVRKGRSSESSAT